MAPIRPPVIDRTAENFALEELGRRGAEDRAQKRKLVELLILHGGDIEKAAPELGLTQSQTALHVQTQKVVQAQKKQAKEEAAAPQLSNLLAAAKQPGPGQVQRSQELSQALAGVGQRFGALDEQAVQTGTSPTGKPQFAPSRAFAAAQPVFEEAVRGLPAARSGLRAAQAEARAKLLSPEQNAAEAYIAQTPGLHPLAAQAVREQALIVSLEGKPSAETKMFNRLERDGVLTREQSNYWQFQGYLNSLNGAKGTTVDLGGGKKIHMGGGAGPSNRIVELISENASIERTVGAAQQFEAFVANNPQLAGLGSRAFRLAAKTQGLVQTIAQFTASTAVLDLMNQGFEVMKEELTQADVEGSEFNKFLEERGVAPTTLLNTDPNSVRDADVQLLMLSFMAAAATRAGTGRLTVDAVKRWENTLDFKKAEGARGTVRAVGALMRQLRDKMVSNRKELIQLRGAQGPSLSQRALEAGNFPGIEAALGGVQAPPTAGGAVQAPPAAAGAVPQGAISVDPNAPAPGIFREDERGVLVLDEP
jgi:hypothetical protein